MRAPRGFGRNYFTLAAIQAYASHVTESQCSVRTRDLILKMDDECDEEADEDVPDDPVVCQHLSLPSHAGHCNCYYRRITRNRLLENPRPHLFIPTRTFSNSVSSPPITHLHHDTFENIKEYE